MRLVFLLGILSPIIATFTAGQASNDQSYDLYTKAPFFRGYLQRQTFTGAAQFSGKFIKEVAKENKKNLVISPISAWLVLCLASFGAQGTTESVFLEVLGLPPFSNGRKFGLQTLVNHLDNYKAEQLSIANAAFLSSSILVNPAFVETTQRAIHSPVQNIDFSRSSEASNTINSWCADKTANRITNIVDADDFDQNTLLVLLNAVHFKGKWELPFSTESTYDRPFFLENGTEIKLPTMGSTRTVLHGKYPEVKSTFIELPFVSQDPLHNMSMFIILPNKHNDFAFLEANFATIDLKKLRSYGFHRQLDIFLPKFVIENKLELKTPLTRMNMGEVFDQNGADFSEIEAPHPHPGSSVIALNSRLFIDKVVQKTFIEVDEKGSEAASASAVGISVTISYRDDFRINHPFYAIIATTGDNPINIFTVRFTGVSTD